MLVFCASYIEDDPETIIIVWPWYFFSSQTVDVSERKIIHCYFILFLDCDKSATPTLKTPQYLFVHKQVCSPCVHGLEQNVKTSEVDLWVGAG